MTEAPAPGGVTEAPASGDVTEAPASGDAIARAGRINRGAAVS
ncbi:hypothetical protein [Rhodopila sp.]